MKRIYSLLTVFSITAISIAQTKALQEYKPESDRYHGTEVLDSYRGFENLEDKNVIDWLKKQSNESELVLNAIPSRDSLIRLQEKYYQKDSSYIYNARITTNGKYFYYKDVQGFNAKRLFYRPTLEDQDVLLFDPKSVEEYADYDINYYKPSWDGRYVAMSLRKEGEEHGILKIYDVLGNKFLPVSLANTAPNTLYGVYWTPNNDGITFLTLPNIDPTDPDYLLNTKAMLYSFREGKEGVYEIADRSLFKDLSIAPEDFPVVRFYDPQGIYAYLEISGSSSFKTMYRKEISNLRDPSTPWKPLYTGKQKVKRIIPVGDTIYYKSAYHNTNFSICKTSTANPDFGCKDLVIHGDSEKVISDFDVSAEGLFFVTQKNGVEAQLFLKSDSISLIKTPKKSGTIIVNAYNKNHAEIILAASGWLNRTETYIYSPKNNSFKNLNFNKSEDDSTYSNLKVTEIEIDSHDGIKVPVSIISHNDVQLDGKNPAFIFGYGSYGNAINPFFSPVYLNWVKEGGIFVVVHTRGGGEKGAAWHDAGRKTTKPNTWKDYIAATEYIISEGYTNPNITVAWGSSAGGIMAGRAITERPDLYKVAIFSSPFFNTLRSEIQPNGLNSIKEFGTFKKEEEFRALLEMDSYHNLKPSKDFPAVFITGGFKDGHTVIWDPAKFFAKLKAVETNELPKIFQVDFNAGHGAMSSGRKKVHQLYADLFAFAFWQTGHSQYQPKKSSN